jgi:NitT/TauT family transport system ATP-binding protein
VIAKRGARLRLSDVARGFDGPGGRREALGGVDLALAPGEIVALVGPNGSGKSTLLRVVAGLLPPDRGRVEIDGQSMTEPIPAVALVFQEPRLLAWRDVIDNVAFPLELAGVAIDARVARARDEVARVGLAGFERVRPAELSGGMRQRAAIARAMVMDPDVLLMDEPFSALDALTRERFDLELRELVRTAGTTVLLVTHSIPEAVLVADRVAVLSQRPGRIVADVPVERGMDGTAMTPDVAAFGPAAAAVRAHLEAAA